MRDLGEKVRGAFSSIKPGAFLARAAAICSLLREKPEMSFRRLETCLTGGYRLSLWRVFIECRARSRLPAEFLPDVPFPLPPTA